MCELGLLRDCSLLGVLERCCGGSPESRFKEGDGYLKQAILSTAENSKRKGRRAAHSLGRDAGGLWLLNIVFHIISIHRASGIGAHRTSAWRLTPPRLGTRPDCPVATDRHPLHFPALCFLFEMEGGLGGTFEPSLLQVEVLYCLQGLRGYREQDLYMRAVRGLWVAGPHSAENFESQRPCICLGALS